MNFDCGDDKLDSILRIIDEVVEDGGLTEEAGDLASAAESNISAFDIFENPSDEEHEEQFILPPHFRSIDKHG